MSNMLMLHQKRSGFTIVELLIVIVVIAILASITVVGYTGISNRAHDTAVQTDLRNFAGKVMEYQAWNGSLPEGQSVLSTGTSGFGPISGLEAFSFTRGSYATTSNNIYYCEGDDRFAVGAVSKSGNKFYYSSSGGLAPYTGTWTASTNAETICPGMIGTTSRTTQSYGFRRSDGGWSAMTR